MRLEQRGITREAIINSVDEFNIIEDYPHDKYLPSCLAISEYANRIFHIVIAMDRDDQSVVIIIAYEPAIDSWNDDLQTRRQS